MRRRYASLVVALVALAGTAWFLAQRNPGGGLHPDRAQLSVEWQGKYRGAMTLPASIHWCPVTRTGVLEAISGDSGVMVALYERDSLTSALHPVVSSDAAASAPRPGASAAMRWMRFDADTALSVFRSASGSVRLVVQHGRASGEIAAGLRSVTAPDSLRIRGVFRDVPVVATAAGCT